MFMRNGTKTYDVLIMENGRRVSVLSIDASLKEATDIFFRMLNNNEIPDDSLLVENKTGEVL